MHSAPEWRQHTHSPISQFISHLLDYDVPVIRNHSRSQLLIRQVAQHILRRYGFQIMLSRQPRHSNTTRGIAQLPYQRTNPPAKLQRSPRLITMPERHLSSLARSRRYQNAVKRNLVNPPGRCTQNKGVAGPALEDHLLIQLTHPHWLVSLAGEKNAICPAIRYCPAIQDRNPLHSSARRNPVPRPVPRNPWPQLRKLVRWIPPRQHIQHAVEHTLAQPGKWCGPAH